MEQVLAGHIDEVEGKGFQILGFGTLEQAPAVGLPHGFAVGEGVHLGIGHTEEGLHDCGRGGREIGVAQVRVDNHDLGAGQVQGLRNTLKKATLHLSLHRQGQLDVVKKRWIAKDKLHVYIGEFGHVVERAVPGLKRRALGVDAHEGLLSELVQQGPQHRFEHDDNL
ncbi:TPR-like protein [Meiothermus ruber H328]|nr:TPR-like protein [Meiothermus ruber H328]